MGNSKAAAAGGDDKIVGIELLRFACAVAVLVFHYQHFTFVGGAPVGLVAAAQPFYPALKLFYDDGFYGVQIFWCISGFIFFWKYGAAIAQRRMDGWKFFILRVSRLYPLHLLTLLFMAALQMVYFARVGTYFVYQENDAYHFILQLFMASNWGLQIGDSFNGPIWSISVEVLVYAVFFLSLRYISASVPLLAGMAAGATLVQLLKISTHPLFSCLMFFYLGCLTAVTYLRCRRSRSWSRVATAIAALAVIGMLLLELHFAIKAKYLLFVVTPALIYLCVTHIPATAGSSRLLVPAGNMTYSSYLLHVPLQILTVTICAYAGLRLPIYSPWMFIAYIAVTLALSAASYRYLEMPAQNWMRKRFMRRTPSVAQSLT